MRVISIEVAAKAKRVGKTTAEKNLKKASELRKPTLRNINIY